MNSTRLGILAIVCVLICVLAGSCGRYLPPARSSGVEATGPQTSDDVAVKTSVKADHNSELHASNSAIGGNSEAMEGDAPKMLMESEGKEGLLLFVNGRYVPRPYQIKGSGNRILLNDEMVFEHPKASEEFAYYEQKTLPPIPAGLTESSSWADIDKIKIDGKQSWHGRFWRYYTTTFEYEEAISKLVEAYRTMPFVKEVEVIESGFHKGRKYIRVTSKSGDRRDVLSFWYTPERAKDDSNAYVIDPLDFRPYPKDFIEKNMDTQLASWKNVISDHDELMILGVKLGSIRIPKNDYYRWLEAINVHRILRSDLDHDAKTSEILKRLFDDPNDLHPRGSNWSIVKQLVENFRSHPQLETRLQELEKKNPSFPLWNPPK